MLSELEGNIESVIYTSGETGYTVARVKATGGKLVTVVGTLLSPVPGEKISMKGCWDIHPRFGRQFKIHEYKTSAPATVQGIERYLGSGLVPGIGRVMAGRIVKKFGAETLDVLENESKKLLQVEGIGRMRIEMIRKAWEEQKEIRQVMIFLQSFGISPVLAGKIYKQYGDHSISIVRENPYRLSVDVFGIGFITADKLAEELGIARDSGARAEAGVLHVLRQCVDEGHVYYPRVPLIQRCQKLLEVDREIISRAVESLAADGKVVLDRLKGFPDRDESVYLPPYYTSEKGVALSISRLLDHPRSVQAIDTDKALAWVQQRLAITLAEKQIEAVKSAMENKLSVITGGPGTGKTTIINALLSILSRAHITALLAAPTGRAAKRMAEATGHEARTIHRLLEFTPRAGGFKRNENDPLNCDFLILDESSMIDIVLMHHLLKAAPREASLLLVGDAMQLPSVGAGNVLKDIIASGRIHVVELTEIFRQARESRIVSNAHRINMGLMPDSEPEGDFFFIRQEDPEKILNLILELAGERIPRKFHLDPIDHIQVLSPMHRGIVGVENLNRVLQERLNPGGGGIVRGEKRFRMLDKVMQIRNNYDKEVYNGDIGRIDGIEEESRKVTVSFDGRKVSYNFSELDEITLAYAVSVHKSQGSEYPAVIIPVVTQHYMLLQRNLIYTAVSRGKRLVVMIGTKKALAIALKNNKVERRYTCLRERL